MISVSKTTKQAYMSDVSKKEIRVVFPGFGLEYDNSSIESESLKITESLSSKDSIEFVGCIASSLQINIYGVNYDIKGKKIAVYIKANNTEEICIFNGVVDSAVIDSNKMFKKITAYDVLYTKGNTDVAKWYREFFPFESTTHTLKEIRDSIFSYIGVDQVDVSLPNDNLVIGKKFSPSTLKCITVIKSICQINGCFGIINREGKFDYRYIKTVQDSVLFPSLTIFPSSNIYPTKSLISNKIAFFESLNYEEYYVKPMERVQIRESESVSGVIVGEEDGNKYIIQSNMFAYGVGETTLETVAQNILDKLDDVSFFPFKSKNNGLPFVECGDVIEFAIPASRPGRYATNVFVVLTRTISGVQLLKDEYNATGTEEQSEFITDLQTQIDTIKQSGGGGGGGDTYTKEEIDEKFEDVPTVEETTDLISEKVNEMETPTGFNVVSVRSLPSTREPNTIYLIQGGVVIV